MKRLGLPIVLALALLAPSPSIARADSDTVLQGHVYRDGCLVPIIGARVVAASLYETREGTTDSNGRFVFFGLLPGTYHILVERWGFDIGHTNNVIVDPGETDFVTVPMTTTLDRHLHGDSVSDW